MHGAIHDYVVLKTVKDGSNYQSGETHDRLLVKDSVTYDYKLLDTQPTYKNILEIGSLDICGSVRKYNFMGTDKFWVDIVGCERYVGLDLMEGPCVDLVASSHNIPFEDNNFDLIVCVSMLEHDSKPLKTLQEAHRVLKVGQPLLLCTVNETWDEHPHLGGGDVETYNKITKKCFKTWITKAGFLNAEVIEWRGNLFCWAIK